MAVKPFAVRIHPAVVKAAFCNEHVFWQLVQAVVVVAVAAAKAIEHNVAVFIQHVTH